VYLPKALELVKDFEVVVGLRGWEVGVMNDSVVSPVRFSTFTLGGVSGSPTSDYRESFYRKVVEGIYVLSLSIESFLITLKIR
jgi:hypothetical protein